MGKIKPDNVLDVLIEYAELFINDLNEKKFYTFYNIDAEPADPPTYLSTFGTNIDLLTSTFPGNEEKVSAAMHTFLRVVHENSIFINRVDKYLHTKDFIRAGVDCRAIAWTDIAKPEKQVKNKKLLMKIAKGTINESSDTELLHIIRYLNVSNCNDDGNEETKVSNYINTCITTGE